jgi:alcohol dehydrogenase class IV
MFEFATATRIVFGEGTLAQVAPAARGLGSRALLVTGADQGRCAPLMRALHDTSLPCLPLAIAGEPTIQQIRTASEYARDERCDLVIAMGGGSAIDAGKAIAALLRNPGEPLEYLEVIGRGQPLEHPSAPFIAVPTTAGTGSEVTRNAVLASPEQRVKASLRSAGMLPRVAVIDPELTAGLPPAVTASTGLDALAQLIEPYVSSRANPMTDLFCADGMRHAATALPRACENGADRAARSAMAWASLLGGLSLANAGLGAVHGFAAPIGGMFPAPHGAVCAALLPHVIEINVEALRARAPQSDALRRYDTVARLLTGQAHAVAGDAVWWLQELTQRLEIPPLREYGVAESDFPALAARAAQASSMKANPIQLTQEELTEILSRAR